MSRLLFLECQVSRSSSYCKMLGFLHLFGGLQMFEIHGMGFMLRRARAEASQYDMSERNS